MRYKRTVAGFYAAAKGLPAYRVAKLAGQYTAGVDFTGQSRRAVAEAYASTEGSVYWAMGHRNLIAALRKAKRPAKRPSKAVRVAIIRARECASRRDATGVLDATGQVLLQQLNDPAEASHAELLEAVQCIQAEYEVDERQLVALQIKGMNNAQAAVLLHQAIRRRDDATKEGQGRQT